MAYKAETPIGRKLEEFLQIRVNKIINLGTSSSEKSINYKKKRRNHIINIFR